jgi:hypothetical protein
LSNRRLLRVPLLLAALVLGVVLSACDTGATPAQLSRIAAEVTEKFAVPCMVTSARRDGKVVIRVYLKQLPPAKPGELFGAVEKVVSTEVPVWERLEVRALVNGKYTPVF